MVGKLTLSATIDLFARKHPRHLLLPYILAEWTVNINHNFRIMCTIGGLGRYIGRYITWSQFYTAFDEVCNMLTNCYFIHFEFYYGPSFQEAIFKIPWEMQTTLSAEVIRNVFSKSRKCHFWRPKIQKFFQGSMPPDPPSKMRLQHSIVN